MSLISALYPVQVVPAFVVVLDEWPGMTCETTQLYLGTSNREEIMAKPVRRMVVAVVLLCFVTVSTACYGPFNLTKNVYHWNSNVKGSGQVNDKWMKEIVFFGMLIVPVYMFSALLDTFIFNSMHFWTGESPIKASNMGSDGTQVTTVGETTIRWTPLDDGAKVVYERWGVVERRATIVAETNGYRLIDENGNVLSEAEYGTDGSVRLLDGTGRVINQWSKKELSAFVENSRRILGTGLIETVGAKLNASGLAG